MRTYSYKKRRNASVISFSSDFNEATRAIRSELGIPAEGFRTTQEMNDWYERHHAENTEELYRPMPSYYWHFPKEFVELVESFSYPDEPSRVNYCPDVPLDRHAMDLIRKFDLPQETIERVKAYVLGVKGSLSVGPALQPILIPINEGDEGIKYIALVAGIDEVSTQKDWLEVWKNIEIVLRLSGMGKTPQKRPIDSLLLRDLSFWKRIKEGKTAREVAADWIEKHPDEEGYPVEDMIRKAVDRVEKIMRPKP